MKPNSRWPLQESDITESLCTKCALCCEIEINPSWKDPRQMQWLHAIVEKHEHIEATKTGIKIRCSHLVDNKCGIYEERPQLCSDFNCVSWAKVSNNREQYNKVLNIFNSERVRDAKANLYGGRWGKH